MGVDECIGGGAGGDARAKRFVFLVVIVNDVKLYCNRKGSCDIVAVVISSPDGGGVS